MNGKNIDFLLSFFFLSAILSYSYSFYADSSFYWPNSQFYIIITISSFFLLYLIISNFKTTKLRYYEIFFIILSGITLGYLLEIFESTGSFSSYVSYFEFFIAMILSIFLLNNHSSRFDISEIMKIKSIVITLIVLQISELIGWVFAGIGLEVILITLSISSIMIYVIFYHVRIKIRILPPIIRGLLLGLLQFIHINGNVNFTGSKTPIIVLLSLFLFTITEQFNNFNDN